MPQWDEGDVPEVQHKRVRINRVLTRSAKITEDEVIEMRRLYWKEGWSYKQCQEKFGMSKTQTNKIIRGLVFAHVWMPEDYIP